MIFIWPFGLAFRNNIEMYKAEIRNIPAFRCINIRNDGTIESKIQNGVPVLIYFSINNIVQLNKHKNKSSDQIKTDIINIFVDSANKIMKRKCCF